MIKEDNETLKYFKKVYELMQDEKYQRYFSILKYYHERIIDLNNQLKEKEIVEYRADIVDIKSKVKNKELKFYLHNGNIYCESIKTGESVIVGSYKVKYNEELAGDE